MKTTLKLFKLQIDEIYSIFKIKNIKKLLLSVAKYILIQFVLFLAVYIIALRVLYLGFIVDKHLIAIVLLLTQCVALIFAVGNIISNLFNSSNNEILLTLPASANEIFLSKIMVIYVREVIVNSLFTMPLLLGLGVYGKFGVYYFISIFPLMLLLPLLPLSIAALLSLPVMKIANLLKKRPVISIILMLVLIVVLLALYVNALSALSNFDVGNKHVDTVIKANDTIKRIGSNTFLFYYLSTGIFVASKIYFVFAYAALGIGLFVCALFFIKPFFFRAAISSKEEVTSKTYKKDYKRCSPLVSLIKKEFLIGFRSPGYVFQYFLFALIMPAVVLLYDELLLSMDIVTQTGKMMIAGSHVLIVCMFGMLSNIVSASAISREGGNFYIVKTSPTNYYIQTGAKLLFNAIFTVSSIVLTCIVTLCMRFSASHSLDVAVIFATTFIALFASLGHMCLSFDMDLRNPTLNWYDSGDVSTVSTNTTKSLVTAVLLSIGFALIIFVTGGKLWGWLILGALSVALFVRQAYILIIRVSYKYEKQEM